MTIWRELGLIFTIQRIADTDTDTADWLLGLGDLVALPWDGLRFRALKPPPPFKVGGTMSIQWEGICNIRYYL